MEVKINRKKVLFDLGLCLLPTIALVCSVVLYLDLLRILIILFVSLTLTLVFMHLSGLLRNFLDLAHLSELILVEAKLIKNEIHLGSRGIPFYSPMIEYSFQGKRQFVHLKKYKYRARLCEGTIVLILIDSQNPESGIIMSLNPYLLEKNK